MAIESIVKAALPSTAERCLKTPRDMIGFRRMTLWQRFLLWISPKRRRKYEADLRAAIDHLVKHPEEPCSIEGKIIPDGFGTREK
jgi:hypothetical protein